MWTHYVMNEYKAETLLDMPSRKTAVPQAAATDTAVTTSVTASNGTDKVTNFKIKSFNLSNVFQGNVCFHTVRLS